MKIRPYAGTGTVSDIGQVAFTYSGGKYIDFVGAKVDGKWTIVDPYGCKPVAYESGGLDPDQVSIVFVGTDISDRAPHSGIGAGFNGSMVDSDGRLWFTETGVPGDIHASETYRFSHIAGYANNTDDVNSPVTLRFNDGFRASNYREAENQYKGTVLLGHRVAETPSTAGTVVNQSPTAGAPVSDLTIPALAVGGGLAALGFGLARRRRA